MTSDEPSTPEHPDPRRAPWPGFALAADAAVQHLRDLVGLDLWLVTAVSQDAQTVVASSGAWAGLAPPGSAMPWPESFCVRMVQRQGPTVAHDVSAVPAYAAAAVGELARVGAYVGVPLEGEHGELFGTLCGFAGAPQPADLADRLVTVELLGRMLSTILAREQFAHARSQDAADAYALVERDRLTGLHNERGWEAALIQEDLRCQRYGGTASVLALDVDDAAAGDADGQQAVAEARRRRCAEVLRRACRPGDVLGRLQDDVFTVLALQCDPVAARALHSRLRVELRVAGLVASVGVATRRTGERLPDAWVRAEQDARRDRRRRGRPGDP